MESGEKDRGLWRDLVAFWILGLGSFYTNMVTVSTASNILAYIDNTTNSFENIGKGRECSIQTNDVVLLAQGIPDYLLKVILPFLPLWLHGRVAVTLLTLTVGILFLASAESQTWYYILGVVANSVATGIGESTFLTYTAGFNKNVVSTWSSGVGCAYIVGFFYYRFMANTVKDFFTIVKVMLIVPPAEAFVFWILLRPPQDNSISAGNQARPEEEQGKDVEPFSTLPEKFKYIFSHLLKYMIPLSLVIFIHVFISLGLMNLLQFEDTFLNRRSQIEWFNICNLIGIFLSCSSVNLVTIDRLWIMPIFQLINAIYFSTEVIWFYTPNIRITFVVAFWDGLLTGGAYVNSFYKVAKEVEPSRKAFSMGIVASSIAFGVFAGFFALPVHNAICKSNAK